MISIIITNPVVSNSEAQKHSDSHQSDREFSNIRLEINSSSGDRSIPRQIPNYISSDNMVISNQPNVTIKNLQVEDTQIVIINSPGVQIVNNSLSYTSDRFAYGIKLVNSPNSLIYNNTVSGLRNDASIAGIILEDSELTVISDNTVSNLTSFSQTDIFGYGIYVSSSPNLLFQNNIIENITSAASFGLFVNSSSSSIITTNSINHISSSYFDDQGESSGILIGYSDRSRIISNQIFNISTITSDGISNSWGIASYLSDKITIQSNEIDHIRSHGSRPEATGIDAYRITDLILSRNLVSSVEVSTPQFGEAYATGIYLLYIHGGDIIANDVSGIFSRGRAAYGLFIDISHQLLFYQNLIHSIRSSSQERATSIGIGLRVGSQFELLNNTIRGLTAYSANNDRNQVSSGTVVGISLDRINSSSLVQNSISSLSSSALINEQVDTIGIITSNTIAITIKMNYIYDLSTDLTVDAIISVMIIWNSKNTDIQSNEIEISGISNQLDIITVLGSSNQLVMNNSITITNSFNLVSVFSLLNGDDSSIDHNHIIFTNPIPTFQFAMIHDFENNSFSHNFVSVSRTDSSVVFNFEDSSRQKLSSNNFSTIRDWIYREGSEDILCEDNYLNGSLVDHNCRRFPKYKVILGIGIGSILLILILILVKRKYE